MPVKLNSRESAIERELVRRVFSAGGVAEKVRVIGSRGFFDRLVVLPGGRVMFVELKRGNRGLLSVHQIRRRDRYQALGAEVYIVRDSEDIDRLMTPR